MKLFIKVDDEIFLFDADDAIEVALVLIYDALGYVFLLLY